MEWINTEDRLPEEGKHVAGWHKSSYVNTFLGEVCLMNEDGVLVWFILNDNRDLLKVTHWAYISSPK